MRRSHPRVSDQLELDQADPWFQRVPWQGQAPRGLTRVGLGLIFTAGAVESASDFVDPLQLDLFPRRRERISYQSRTAPSLLPLPF